MFIILTGRSFPDWSQRFASQKEIQQYWDGIARDKFHLERSTTFNTNVEKAIWNENDMLWVVETIDTKTGQQKTWTCNVVSYLPSTNDCEEVVLIPPKPARQLCGGLQLPKEGRHLRDRRLQTSGLAYAGLAG